MNNTIISHIKQDVTGWEEQSNEEHQEGVAKLASQFAGEFGMAEWGRVLGLLHDKGKEQKTFQQHIQKESGKVPHIRVEGDYTHAYVGALIAKKLYRTPPFYQFIDNILMGHHRGLYDHDDKEEILKKEIPNDVSVEPLSEKLNMLLRIETKDVHHLIRMLFSCLVDADRLDTEEFMLPEQSKLRGGKSTVEELLQKLEKHLAELKKNAADTEVNKIRNEVQQYCIKTSEDPVDFYSLTVPTGGGKTLSSVLWALRHAKKNGLKRVIIAIPYTSIITQTAAVLRNIFGDENVLEHHSNVNLTDENETTQRLKLATENWDYPIVITTNVQLFESLFSNKPSDCRKLHNIVNSVLILDEVQTLPMEFLRPIVDTLDTLKRVFNVSVLFTTASQPVLSGRIEGATMSFEALPNIRGIIPQSANLHNRLKRVNLYFDRDASTYDEIVQRICQHNIVLCIVNTRKDAYEIYNRLPQIGLTLHLSRMMCPTHVRETIEVIKDALKSHVSTIRVISTQLVEAGVDIDFPIVFRQEAGLDSIVQAAGRCNREGKLDNLGITYVFKLKERLHFKGMMSKGIDSTKQLLLNPQYKDFFSKEAMNEYFKFLYSECNFDKNGIVKNCFEENSYGEIRVNFENVNKYFQLIDNETKSVIVNWKDSHKYIKDLKEGKISYKLMREISQYSVNIRKDDFDELYSYDAITVVQNNIYIIDSLQFYNANVGLEIKNRWLEEPLIICSMANS